MNIEKLYHLLLIWNRFLTGNIIFYNNYFPINLISFPKLFSDICDSFQAILQSIIVPLSIAKECLLPFESAYRYRLRRIVCPYSLLSFMYKINRRRVNGQVGAERRDDVSLKRLAKSLPLAPRGAKASDKITGPFQPIPARHPTLRPGPLLPTPSVPHAACRRGPRPRVSICGQCTLLHEPRPFTEGPRNATALNNHPPEDRRPCAPERAQEAQGNKAGIRIRRVAGRKYNKER